MTTNYVSFDGDPPPGNSGYESDALGDVGLTTNQEPRCPVVLLVDKSGSMGGDRIAQVNKALAEFGGHVREDTLTSLRVDAAVMAFNHRTELVRDFVNGSDFQPPPTIKAGGGTNVSAAVMAALDLVEQRKAQYRDLGLTYYRAFIMALTDGKPEHDTEQQMADAAIAVQQAEAGRHAKIVCFGIAGNRTDDGADIAAIRRIIPSTYPKLVSTDQIPGALEWLANSVKVVSYSNGDIVDLPTPEGFLTF